MRSSHLEIFCCLTESKLVLTTVVPPPSKNCLPMPLPRMIRTPHTQSGRFFVCPIVTQTCIISPKDLGHLIFVTKLFSWFQCLGDSTYSGWVYLIAFTVRLSVTDAGKILVIANDERTCYQLREVRPTTCVYTVATVCCKKPQTLYNQDTLYS